LGEKLAGAKAIARIESYIVAGAIDGAKFDNTHNVKSSLANIKYNIILHGLGVFFFAIAN
jgi:hypothetical protein